jgi:hypothetical protein
MPNNNQAQTYPDDDVNMCRYESAGGVKPSPATNRDSDKVDAILVASQRSSSLCTMVEGHSYGIEPPRYCLQYGLNRTLVSRDDSLSQHPSSISRFQPFSVLNLAWER